MPRKQLAGKISRTKPGVPTRNHIIQQLKECPKGQDKIAYISAYLDEIGVPVDDKDMIMEDLNSYAEFTTQNI